MLEKLGKKWTIIVGAVVVIALVAAIGFFVNARNTEARKKREAEVVPIAINGWKIKNDARLDSNKDKVREFKQKLIEYYDAESGALVRQQRLIDSLIAADSAAATDDNSGEKVLSFHITDVTFDKVKVGDKESEIVADIEFYIRYITKTQTYSTYGQNTYKWLLKKADGKWKIVKEELIPGGKS